MNSADIGKSLKQMLFQKELTIKDLSEKLGISRANLTNALNGKVGMNLDTFLKVADELGIEITFPEDVKQNEQIRKALDEKNRKLQGILNELIKKLDAVISGKSNTPDIEYLYKILLVSDPDLMGRIVYKYYSTSNQSHKLPKELQSLIYDLRHLLPEEHLKEDVEKAKKS